MSKTVYYLIVGFLTVLIIIQGYKLIWGEKGIIDSLKYDSKIEKLLNENRILVHRNNDLKKKINKLQNDNKYLKRLIREKLNMVKDDEIIIKFKDKKKHETR